MRVCFVIQRYGDGVVGGAESYVQSMATGLAALGHQVTVLTSCATSYADWADVHPPGRTVEDGVAVHRFPVRAARDNDRFFPLHLRAVDVWDVPLWPWAQDRWSQLMGPDLDGVEQVLAAEAASSDATVLVGYHYAQTLRLTRVAAAHGPTIVIPTAHPEGAFHVGRVREVFEHADHVISLAPEEGELVGRTYDCSERITVVPCPVAPLERPTAEVVTRAVRRVGATEGRYAVVVGRVDPAKGSDDVIRFTAAYRRMVDPDFELVVIGPGGDGAAATDGVRLTGFVEEQDKVALVAGAGVVVQPSYMESFSLALIEGWLLGRPALVQGRSRVLEGHVRRSGGGLAYTDYTSFEAALATLRARPEVAAALAERGRRYSLHEFAWERVAPAFVEVVERTAASGGRRLAARTRVVR
jgi:glycosyltransferase involved in cell wall biosynthesis